MPTSTATISSADLSHKTREIFERVRRGGPVMVESAGEEPMVLLDALEYRLLRCLANRAGAGPREAEDAVLRDVLDRYLSEEISLGKAAELLGLSRWELQARLQRLGLALPLGPATLAEAQAEAGAARDYSRR